MQNSLPFEVSFRTLLLSPLFPRGIPKYLYSNSEQYLQQPAGRAPIQLTQEQIDSQGNYVEMEHGVEVPFSGRALSDLMNKDYHLPAPANSSKRRAEAPARRRAGQPRRLRPHKKTAPSEKSLATEAACSRLLRLSKKKRRTNHPTRHRPRRRTC